jgi:peptide deformylase
MLKEKSRAIEHFDSELHTLLDDMYETMLSREGIGLAAIQIGVPKRAFLLNIPDEEGMQSKENLVEVINPKVIEKHEETQYNEGCLSLPEFYEEVKRAKSLSVEYYTREGERIERRLEGLEAIAFQHESDHLDGVLFVDRLSLVKRKKFEKEWKKRQKSLKL